MNITVILCTYNRCQSLAKALESVAAQTLPESVQWEVLVVDNNSNDQTREVVEAFCHRYPGRFRYLFEPQQGKTYALNAGIRESRSDVLAFVDDDVTVEPTWLQALTAPLNGRQWAGVGGRTVLAQRYSPPLWMSLGGPYSMGGALAALFDFGDNPCELDWPPYGTNMAFRREMFEKYGGFRTDLGRSAGGTLSNADTEFGRRLLAAGERLFYDPSAIVYHPVPQNRVQKDFFLTWWFNLGRSNAREWGRGPSVLGIPRPYFNILKLGTIVMAERLGRWILSVNPQQRFYNKCRVWETAGQMKEYYRLAGRNQAKKNDSIPECRAS